MSLAHERVDLSHIPQDALVGAKWLSEVLPNFYNEDPLDDQTGQPPNYWSDEIPNYGIRDSLFVTVSHGRGVSRVELELAEEFKEVWLIKEYGKRMNLEQVEVWRPATILEWNMPLVPYRNHLYKDRNFQVMYFSFEFRDGNLSPITGTPGTRPSDYPLRTASAVNLPGSLGMSPDTLNRDQLTEKNLRRGITISHVLKSLILSAAYLPTP